MESAAQAVAVGALRGPHMSDRKSVTRRVTDGQACRKPLWVRSPCVRVPRRRASPDRPTPSSLRSRRNVDIGRPTGLKGRIQPGMDSLRNGTATTRPLKRVGPIRSTATIDLQAVRIRGVSENEILLTARAGYLGSVASSHQGGTRSACARFTDVGGESSCRWPARRVFEFRRGDVRKWRPSAAPEAWTASFTWPASWGTRPLEAARLARQVNTEARRFIAAAQRPASAVRVRLACSNTAA